MRIISQNGKTDLPYDNLGLSIEDNIIMAEPLNWGRAYVMAEYSSEEKARCAAEKLKEKYLEHKSIGDGRGHASLLVKPKIFRFPEDKDVVL